MLLLAADRDGVAPPAASEATAGVLPDARFGQLDHCRHISPLERPALLLELVRDFLFDRVAQRAQVADKTGSSGSR